MHRCVVIIRNMYIMYVVIIYILRMMTTHQCIGLPVNIVKNFVRKIFHASRKFSNCTLPLPFIRGSIRPWLYDFRLGSHLFYFVSRANQVVHEALSGRLVSELRPSCLRVAVQNCQQNSDTFHERKKGL